MHFARPWTQASNPELTDSINSLAAKRRAEALHVVFFFIRAHHDDDLLLLLPLLWCTLPTTAAAAAVVYSRVYGVYET